MSSKNLQHTIEKLHINIEELRIQKDKVRALRLLMEPEALLNPIKPKKGQNVAIAGVLGLMLGIFTTFFQEFWEKTVLSPSPLVGKARVRGKQ